MPMPRMARRTWVTPCIWRLSPDQPEALHRENAGVVAEVAVAARADGVAV